MDKSEGVRSPWFDAPFNRGRKDTRQVGEVGNTSQPTCLTRLPSSCVIKGDTASNRYVSLQCFLPSNGACARVKSRSDCQRLEEVFLSVSHSYSLAACSEAVSYVIVNTESCRPECTSFHSLSSSSKAIHPLYYYYYYYSTYLAASSTKITHNMRASASHTGSASPVCMKFLHQNRCSALGKYIYMATGAIILFSGCMMCNIKINLCLWEGFEMLANILNCSVACFI